mgnify:CR=1 FL=1
MVNMTARTDKDKKYMYSFDEEHYYGDFPTIKDAYKRAHDSFMFSENNQVYIGCSDKPFKINGSLIDSERIMEDMEQTALDEEQAYFDEDPYPLTDKEYRELSDEIALAISMYLSRKFANISGLGVDTLHRVVNAAAIFDMNGRCLEVVRGDMGIQPGWEVGDSEQ